MRIEEDLKLGFKDVLIRPKIQVRVGPACRLLPQIWTP